MPITKVHVQNPGLTQEELISQSLTVIGPLTNAELRAASVPVSGNWLTDTQLRATPIPVDLLDSTYGFANYDASGDPIYLGYLDKSGNYYIQRITTATGVVDYSSGSSGYSTAWTNRATETYQAYNLEF